MQIEAFEKDSDTESFSNPYTSARAYNSIKK